MDEDGKTTMEPILQGAKVSKNFDGVQALIEVDLAIRPGEIFGLIGPNGAGKTTFFNVVTGMDVATSGRISLGSLEITKKKPFAITKLGVARTWMKRWVGRSRLTWTPVNLKPDLPRTRSDQTER